MVQYQICQDMINSPCAVDYNNHAELISPFSWRTSGEPIQLRAPYEL